MGGGEKGVQSCNAIVIDQVELNRQQTHKMWWVYGAKGVLLYRTTFCLHRCSNILIITNQTASYWRCRGSVF